MCWVMSSCYLVSKGVFLSFLGEMVLGQLPSTRHPFSVLIWSSTVETLALLCEPISYTAECLCGSRRVSGERNPCAVGSRLVVAERTCVSLLGHSQFCASCIEGPVPWRGWTEVSLAADKSVPP